MLKSAPLDPSILVLIDPDLSASILLQLGHNGVRAKCCSIVWRVEVTPPLLAKERAVHSG